MNAKRDKAHDKQKALHDKLGDDEVVPFKGFQDEVPIRVGEGSTFGYRSGGFNLHKKTSPNAGPALAIQEMVNQQQHQQIVDISKDEPSSSV